MDGYIPNQNAAKTVSALQKCVSIFLDQLSAERDFLLNSEAEKLSEITKDKQQTLNELTLLENQIRPYLPLFSNEVPQDSDSKNKDELQTMQRQWNELSGMLIECQKINAENGTLVHTKLKQTKSALDQLYSLCNISNSVTYNEQGNQQFSSQSNRSVHV